jgi:hypothetical protein
VNQSYSSYYARSHINSREQCSAHTQNLRCYTEHCKSFPADATITYVLERFQHNFVPYAVRLPAGSGRHSQLLSRAPKCQKNPKTVVKDAMHSPPSYARLPTTAAFGSALQRGLNYQIQFNSVLADYRLRDRIITREFYFLIHEKLRGRLKAVLIRIVIAALNSLC